jgi:hypothetical protein
MTTGEHCINADALGIDRCPHCNVADPNLKPETQFRSHGVRSGRDYWWGIFSCASCGGIVAGRAAIANLSGNVRLLEAANELLGKVDDVFPRPTKVATELPEKARRYLQQAMDSIAAPDAAVVVASASVDAMLQEIGYTGRASLHDKINKALEEGKLTADMADWAHEVRLVSNDARHADKENPHATIDQARQMVEFAEALGEFLFVLPARITRARADGRKA